jgi:threonine aldolase
MGDFADNWTGSRDKMVEAMKKFRDSVEGADQARAEAEQKMVDSLAEHK